MVCKNSRVLEFNVVSVSYSNRIWGHFKLCDSPGITVVISVMMM